MRLLLATIEHSGTRFFANLLAPTFGAPKIAGCNDYAYVADGPRFLVTHVQWRELIDRYISEFAPLVVTTVRCLDALRGSYVRRNVAEDLPHYLSAWLDFAAKHRPLVVSVDAADREQRVARLSAATGIDLPTTWEPTIRWPGEI